MSRAGEQKAGDRGAIARTSGDYAIVVSHNPDTGVTRVKMPSGSKKARCADLAVHCLGIQRVRVLCAAPRRCDTFIAMLVRLATGDFSVSQSFRHAALPVAAAEHINLEAVPRSCRAAAVQGPGTWAASAA